MNSPDPSAVPKVTPRARRRTAWISQGLEVLAGVVVRRNRMARKRGKAPGDAAAHVPFDIVIVGSGYGAAVAADRLAGARDKATGRKLSVVVLERGKEYLPGSFPTGLADVAGHVRFTTPAMHGAKGRLEGLFDIRVGADMSVLIANGLGGGSLINAGVLEFPNEAVFDQPAWPPPLRGNGASLRRKAVSTLRPLLGAGDEDGTANTIKGTTFDGEAPPRSDVMKRLSGNHPLCRPALSIALHEGRASRGNVKLERCIGCGDCFTGCNFGAKDSLDVNLLRRAKLRGAHLYTGATVTRLKKARDGWALEVWHTDQKLRQRMAGPIEIHARRVVLAAGALGSTEILMRSRKELRLSALLGHRFSGNGDMLAMLYDMKPPQAPPDAGWRAGAVVDEQTAPAERHIGPTITHMIDLRDDAANSGCVIQDLAVPGSLRRVFEEATVSAALLHSLDVADRTTHSPVDDVDDPCSVVPARIDRSMALAVITHDDASGRLDMVPEPDGGLPADAGLVIEWPKARDDARLQASMDALVSLASPKKPRMRSGDDHDPVRGKVLPNPAWQALPGPMSTMLRTRRGPLLTVHPLGGCAMAQDRTHGVVNRRGQVFDAGASNGADVHAGLVVLDGSIVPCSLGINPALTIATLARQAIDALLSEHDAWTDVVPADVTDVRAATAAGHAAAAHALDCVEDRVAALVAHPAKAAPTPAIVERPVFRVIDPRAKPPPVRRTKVEVIERLHGKVSLDGRERWVELTLHYEPIALHPMPGSEGTRGTTLDVKVSPQSRLRIFDDLQPPDDDDGSQIPERSDADACLIAPIAEGSTLRFFHREASCSWGRRVRSMWGAWLLNRGLRDTTQAIGEYLTGAGEPVSMRARAQQAWRLASHAGEARLFQYALVLGRPYRLVDGERQDPKRAWAKLGRDARIEGRKRLRYERRSSPWAQLMELELSRVGAFALGKPRLLRVDPMYFVRRQVPLMRLVDQQDQPSALFDVASFLLRLTRLLISVHLWSFRKPDDPHTREPDRLPGALRGLPPPQIHWIGGLPGPSGRRDDATRAKDGPANGAARDTGRIRLTRYAPRNDNAQPVLMIHGYSASGTTFAHKTLSSSLAAHLWERGFDPWIVDLRTSCGLRDSALLPWTFEDIARHDIPAAIGFVHRATQRKVDIVSHCMGSAMLAMSILDPRRTDDFAPEQHIRRWVMTQIGPAMRFTPANTLRAYLMKYLLGYLADVEYDLRPGTAVPGVDANLYDRLLHTLPYPGDAYGSEFDVENPPWPPWRRTPWVGTRHRLDAMVGRTFDSRNLSRRTLEHIDDFFGAVNLTTLSQPVHFAGFGFVSDAAGLSRWGVDRLNQRLAGIPMSSLHSDCNGLADRRTEHLMRAYAALADLDLRTETLRGFGHQDALIGKNSCRVHDSISDFLGERPWRRRQDQLPRSPKGPRVLRKPAPAASPFFAVIPSYDVDPSVELPRARGTAWAYQSYCRQAVLVPMRRQSGRWLRLGPPRPLALQAQSTSHYWARVDVSFDHEPNGTELVAVFFIVQSTLPTFDHPQAEVERSIDALLIDTQRQPCGPSGLQP